MQGPPSKGELLSILVYQQGVSLEHTWIRIRVFARIVVRLKAYLTASSSRSPRHHDDWPFAQAPTAPTAPTARVISSLFLFIDY